MALLSIFFKLYWVLFSSESVNNFNNSTTPVRDRLHIAVNVDISAGGKFRKNVCKTFHVGLIFHDSPPISFIKAYGLHFRVGVIFAKKTKAQKTRKVRQRENFHVYSITYSKPINCLSPDLTCLTSSNNWVSPLSAILSKILANSLAMMGELLAEMVSNTYNRSETNANQLLQLQISHRDKIARFCIQLWIRLVLFSPYGDLRLIGPVLNSQTLQFYYTILSIQLI